MIEQLIEQLKAKEKSLLAYYIKARTVRRKLEIERYKMARERK